MIINGLDQLEELAKCNDYFFENNKGYIKYGPSNICLINELPLPPIDNEVYITELPKDVDPMLIFNKFSQVNKIYRFRMQHNSCYEMNTAFVHYLDVEDAKAAVKFYNDEELSPGGPKIKVLRPKYNKRLHVGYFDKRLSKEEIINYFMSRLKNLSKVTIPEEEIKGRYMFSETIKFTKKCSFILGNFKNPGFCSLLFKTGLDAKKAKQQLQLDSISNNLKLGNRDIRTIELFNGFQEVIYANRKCLCNKKPTQVINTVGVPGDIRLVLTNFREDACVAMLKRTLDSHTKDYNYLRYSRQGPFVLFYFTQANNAHDFLNKFQSELFIICFLSIY